MLYKFKLLWQKWKQQRGWCIKQNLANNTLQCSSVQVLLKLSNWINQQAMLFQDKAKIKSICHTRNRLLY